MIEFKDLYKLAEQIESELSGDKPYSFEIFCFDDASDKDIRVSLICKHLKKLVEQTENETNKSE